MIEIVRVSEDIVSKKGLDIVSNRNKLKFIVYTPAAVKGIVIVDVATLHV